MKWLRTLTCAAVLSVSVASAQTPATAPDIDGLWAAHMRYGPDVRGPMLVQRQAGALSGEIAGFYLRSRTEGNDIVFEFPNGGGAFRGHFANREATIVGHWI